MPSRSAKQKLFKVSSILKPSLVLELHNKIEDKLSTKKVNAYL